MKTPIDFGIDDYREIVATLEPQIDYGANGMSQDEPWTDTPRFFDWLSQLGLGQENVNALLELVPLVSVALNHGPLLGVKRFMEENSGAGHKIRDAGFLIFGIGPNGDFVVVDTEHGNGQSGWLPMAMIWEMNATQVRDHFIPTNQTLGAFIRASEENWSSVPKDWYDAKVKTAKKQIDEDHS